MNLFWLLTNSIFRPSDWKLILIFFLFEITFLFTFLIAAILIVFSKFGIYVRGV